MNLIEQTFYNAAVMLWETFWALTLGFLISAALQVYVRKESIFSMFGKTNVRSMGLAMFLGAVSSSCSYAATAAAKSAFQKGAALAPALAFMFASTNLVLELGIVLWILMGWHFLLAEVVGSFVLVGIMWPLVSLVFPKKWEEEARHVAMGSKGGGGCCSHKEEPEEESSCHHHSSESHESSFSLVPIIDAFFMDVSMMWKEIAIGFVISGFLMAALPAQAWHALFLTGSPAPVQLVENATVGVLIASLSCVCSVGNLPLAALLWSQGISFGGVISFIFGDLVIIPLLMLYRKYYGWKAALGISAILGISMVLSGIVMELLFSALGLIPLGPRPMSPMMEEHFSWNYTSWLDIAALAILVFGAITAALQQYKTPLHEGH